MIIGLSTSAFTLLHTVISLIAIASGLIVAFALCRGSAMRELTAVFLATTLATSVTGFLFPSTRFGPPQVVGGISLFALALAISALYIYRLSGPWRWIYVVTAMLSLYLNVFVGVVQAFDKLPSLHALAPTGTEPAFKLAQSIVLAGFLVLGFFAVRRYHPVLSERTFAGRPA